MSNQDVTARMRQMVEERDARARSWEAREYPPAAYEAVDLLTERIGRPRRHANDWLAHVAQAVRDAVKPDDPRDARAIAAAVEPDLRNTVDMLNRASPLEHLERARQALTGLTRPMLDRATLAESPTRGTSELEGAIAAQNARRREREEAQDQREAQTLAALTALVAYGQAEAEASEERDRRQDARDRRVLRWTIASVVIGGVVGGLGILTAILIALAS